MVYRFFDKKTRSGAKACVSEELAQELHKPMINNLKGGKYMRDLKIIFGQQILAKMGSLSSKNRGVKYLLCVIDVFIEYAWINPLKDKKAKTILNSFVEIVNKSKHKPNKLWLIKEENFRPPLVEMLLILLF